MSPHSLHGLIDTATTVCSSQSCLFISGPKLTRVTDLAILDTDTESFVGTSQDRCPSPNQSCYYTTQGTWACNVWSCGLLQPAPFPILGHPLIWASCVLGPVSSCPAGGLASPRGSSSECTQTPGGQPYPSRLHFTGRVEELLCGPGAGFWLLCCRQVLTSMSLVSQSHQVESTHHAKPGLIPTAQGSKRINKSTSTLSSFPKKSIGTET